jgi:hypothetical protein
MKFSAMSPAEIQFIRLYVSVLRRDYYVLRSVMDVMHPANLGVKNFVDATKIALKLEELQLDFDAKLRACQRKNKIRVRNVPAGPTLDELADMFSLSFFKLVVTSHDKSGADKKVHQNGWFSGKPYEWKKTLNAYKGTPKEKTNSLPDVLTNFFAAALKFFPFDNKTWSLEDSGLTKKVWPPKTNNWHLDEYDEEDDDQGAEPFDWLFGPDED